MSRFAILFILVSLAGGQASQAAEAPRGLTLKEAHQIALEKHPKISVAELKALAARQAVRESRSGLWPSLSLNAGAAGASGDSTRIVAGTLTVSSVFDRASTGATLTQLVSDFGRTANLIASSVSHARAEEQHVEVVRAQLILQVDGAFFGALQAQELLRVADETVRARRLLHQQVSVLASNQLKSDLDVSFAEVNLEEARLLRSRTENEVQAAHASLAALLGERETARFQLAEEPASGSLATNIATLIHAALRNRPELLRLRLERDSAFRFARAERALSYPTVSLQGTAGVIPYREAGLNQDYAAAGVVVNWPLFDGHLHDARQQAARLRAQAAEAAVREEENNIIRDVRIAWLNAGNARERLAITVRLLGQARKSLALAEARYKAGASSMVELSQAQLNQTGAEISQATARYELRIRLAFLHYQVGARHQP